MIESGFITEAQAAEALRQKTSTRVARDDIAPHFADWILAQVRDYLGDIDTDLRVVTTRSEEHTSELQSLMRISYAVFCLKKKKQKTELISYTTMTSTQI